MILLLMIHIVGLEVDTHGVGPEVHEAQPRLGELRDEEQVPSIYVYIYIYRERERYIYIYIYCYLYMLR